MSHVRKMQMALAAAGLLTLASCSKSNNNSSTTTTTTTTTTNTDTVALISNASPLSGNVSGIMGAGRTYTLGGDITVPVGDTLTLQSGVTIKVPGKYDIIVKGRFISLGTQTAPNWITPGTAHQDQPFSSITAALTSDPAFSGEWMGINCDTSCDLFIMKWTHVEFGGATFGQAPVAGTAAGTASWLILFQNGNGTFDLEDSWIYGSTDDAVRVTLGNINCMRNTFEKCGSNTGESFNVKSGTVGDIAYNVFIGSATNGAKISNAGATPVECNIHCYNNTIIDCGYRQSSTSGHGGSINLEKDGEAFIYNNLIANCKIGLRIVNTADTNNAKYGNTFFYGDDATVTGEFYSVGDVTHPQTTDLPLPSSYLPSGYVLGAAYDGSAVVGKNNPNFKSFTLPNTNYQNVNNAAGFDFHLNSGSPAISAGTTAFVPLAKVKVDPTYGATEITLPGADIGAYQSNGTGNKH
jgi:hypothetical protein